MRVVAAADAADDEAAEGAEADRTRAGMAAAALVDGVPCDAAAAAGTVARVELAAAECEAAAAAALVAVAAVDARAGGRRVSAIFR